jgi:hypothetical protein
MWPINVGDRVRVKTIDRINKYNSLIGQLGTIIEMDFDESDHEQMPLIELDNSKAKLVFWPSELECADEDVK